MVFSGFFNHLRKTILTCGVAALALSATPVLSCYAADLPLASGSPLVGITFDDRPLLLPVQRNFQMAMLTASSEIGRSCGRMEAYGWRLNAAEQGRVNAIFSATVERMRGVGYVVEGQSLSSVSPDITLFTADRSDRHFLFMWSAGEIGLAMVVCETSGGSMPVVPASVPVPAKPAPQDVVKNSLPATTAQETPTALAARFSPLGEWLGNFTCAQGHTGATLAIKSLKGENFEGEFRFYPTPRNPYAASGRYTVYGQYDGESKRILINPGKWLERPKGYTNTVMVGAFDPSTKSFSGYFQGVDVCTSFEARRTEEPVQPKPVSVKPKKVIKKKPVQQAELPPEPAQPSMPEAAQTNNNPTKVDHIGAKPEDILLPASSATTTAGKK